MTTDAFSPQGPSVNLTGTNSSASYQITTTNNTVATSYRFRCKTADAFIAFGNNTGVSVTAAAGIQIAAGDPAEVIAGPDQTWIARIGNGAVLNITPGIGKK